jgi:hypothetical protein
MARFERVLSVGRAFLTVSALTPIYLDPAQPARLAAVTYAVLAAYAVYSLIVLVYVRRTARLSVTHGHVLHGVDVLWTAVLTFVSEGPVSPFFLFFLFVVLSAAYRWGFVGTIVTTCVSVAHYDQWQIRDDAERTPEECGVAAPQAVDLAAVERYCDGRGTSEYNLALGDRRANAIRGYSMSRGIAPDRLLAVSKGEEASFCGSETEQCWQQNGRRPLRHHRQVGASGDATCVPEPPAWRPHRRSLTCGTVDPAMEIAGWRRSA